MTTINSTTENKATTNDEHTTHPGIQNLDLTPEGLADAPASEQDTDSIVHTGNS